METADLRLPAGASPTTARPGGLETVKEAFFSSELGSPAETELHGDATASGQADPIPPPQEGEEKRASPPKVRVGVEQMGPAQAAQAVDRDESGLGRLSDERAEQVLERVFDSYVRLRMKTGGTGFRRPFLAEVDRRFGASVPRDSVVAAVAMAEGFARFLLEDRGDEQQTPSTGGTDAKTNKRTPAAQARPRPSSRAGLLSCPRPPVPNG